MGALSKIESAGFSVSLMGESMAISPASNLTQTQKDFLKSHRAEIIAELKSKTLSAAYRNKLLDYMAAIGETDQDIIDEFIDRCAYDTDALAWALSWADRTLFFADDRRHCAECSNLSGGRCLAAWRGEIVASRHWRPIDDIPRRCAGYSSKRM